LKYSLLTIHSYPGYSPMVDPTYPGVKRIVYGFPTQNTRGVGPVLDPTTPDIACRKDATPPALVAPARAGSNIKFQWTNYFTSHKGPVLTYMARMDSPDQKVTDLKFFKIDEGTYDPKTGNWGSDKLIAQNNSWTSQIPSDLKAGDYVVRHELIALHFGLWGDAKGKGTQSSGAQFIPECVRIKLSGSGTATPPGQTFPGLYKPTDSGIKVNIYYGPNKYVCITSQLRALDTDQHIVDLSRRCRI
jgi:cellulase